MTDYYLDRSGDARRTLSRVVRDYGQAGIDDARLLSTLLPDLMPGSDREAALVLAAANAGVGTLLADRIGHGMPPDGAVRNVSSMLADRNAFEPRACEWVVSEYARALGYPVADGPVSPAAGGTPGIGPAVAGGAAGGLGAAAAGFPTQPGPIRAEPPAPPPGYPQFGGYPQSTSPQPGSPGTGTPTQPGFPDASPPPGGYPSTLPAPGGFPASQPGGYPSASQQGPPYTPAGGYPSAHYPPAPKKRTGLIVGVVVLALLLVGGGIFAAIKLTGNNNSGSSGNHPSMTGAACLVGNWKSSKLPTTFPGQPNSKVLSGSHTATFSSDNTGSQTLSDVVVQDTEGGTTVNVTVNGTINYHFTATDSLITYTDVSGTLTLEVDGQSTSQNEDSVDPDAYHCSGDTLTFTTNGEEDLARQ